MNKSGPFINNTQTFESCSQVGDRTSDRIWKTISYSILAVVSIVGNSLVIATVYRNSKLRSTTHRLIVNMAISDLLLPLFAVPRKINEIWQQAWLFDGMFGNALCKIVPFCQDISSAVSVLSLIIIAVDRLWLVVFPTKKPIFTSQRTVMAILATWIIASSLYASYFYTSRLVNVSGMLLCTYNWEPAFDNAKASKIHFLVSFITLVIFPVLFLVVVYSIIIRVIKQRERTATYLSKVSKTKREKRNRKIIVLLVTIVTVFFLSWSPVSVFGFLIYFVWDFHRECNLNTIVFVLVFLSFSYSAINPFIYYTFNENYREGFNSLLRYSFSKKTPKLINQRKTFAMVGNLENAEKKPTQNVELIELKIIDTKSTQKEQIA